MKKILLIFFIISITCYNREKAVSYAKKLGKEIIEKFQNDFYSLSERESMNNNNFQKKISMSHNSLKISNTEENESKIKNYCC